MTRPSVRNATSREARIAARGRVLWERYRFTVEQWFAQYAFQGGCCYFCKQPGGDLGSRGRKFRDPTGRRELDPLVYDHSHDPPYRFRGLGHRNCNRRAGIIERALQDPPAYREGGVKHEVPPDRAAQLERSADSRRSSARARRGRASPPARPPAEDRATYLFPQPSTALLEALAELTDARQAG